MYRRILAFDYDGTLAHDGRIPPALQRALEQLCVAGYVLFLVTGRRFDEIKLGALQGCFTGIVWENGAVLSLAAGDELYLPFGHIDPRLVNALEAAGVPLEHGMAISATWDAHEETVWHVLSATYSDAVIVHNKGALMLLPPGAAKGSGLERLLELGGFSRHNLVCFGDGENDLSLLQLGETGIAVADAVPSLKAIADVITCQAGPAGVLHALQTYWLQENPAKLPVHNLSPILLGEKEDETPVFLSGVNLVSENLGVFGDSGSGKSWVTGLLAEGMHMAGYQVLIIDAEGDYRNLSSLPRFLALAGNEHDLPAPALVTALLEEASLSVVLDLCALSMERREAYVTDLLHALRALRNHKFRPHWVVLEEAQQFVSPSGNTLAQTLLPMLAAGGWTLVSFRPDRLYPPILTALDRYLLARLSVPAAFQALQQHAPLPPSADALAHTPPGYVWMCDQSMIRLRSAARRVPHIRHLYKYLDMPLPKEKRFYFRTSQGYLGSEAASLFEFKEMLASLPIESLAYHQARGDFAAWVRGSLGDEQLAIHLEKLTHRTDLTGEALRHALLQRVNDHYMETTALYG